MCTCVGVWVRVGACVHSPPPITNTPSLLFLTADCPFTASAVGSASTACPLLSPMVRQCLCPGPLPTAVALAPCCVCSLARVALAFAFVVAGRPLHPLPPILSALHISVRGPHMYQCAGCLCTGRNRVCRRWGCERSQICVSTTPSIPDQHSTPSSHGLLSMS